MIFEKLIILLAFGVFVYISWTNTEWISVAFAQVVPSVQSQSASEPALTNNNASSPFSLPSIKLDNSNAIAKMGPVAVAGPDQIVNEGSTVTLNGTQSTDPNGIILSYSWRQIPTNHFITLSGADTPIWSFTAPRISTDTTLTFELMVTDNNGLTNSSTVNILIKHIPYITNQSTEGTTSIVNNPPIAGIVPKQTSSTTNQSTEGTTSIVNNPPIAGIVPKQTSSTTNQSTEGTAPTSTNQILNSNVTNVDEPLIANTGPDKIVQKGDSVTLDGSNSTGPITSYSWKQINGKSVKLVDANIAKSMFIAPSVNKDSMLKFKLTVDDGKGKTSTAIVNVLVMK